MTTLLHVLAVFFTNHSALWRLQGPRLGYCIALLICSSAIPGIAYSQTPAPLVALASSFRGPWPELMRAYQTETGQQEPRTSFASSGLLTTQIRHGAPFELYLSADQMTVQQLHELGKTQDAGITLARGTLSLVWQTGSVQAPPEGTSSENRGTGLAALLAMQAGAKSFKLAIPNPLHAPYGVAARQALETAGLWPLPAGKLLNAENAAQTLQFALSGAVDYAIVPDTLVTRIPETLQKLPLKPDSYEAVIHQMVLLNGAGPAAQELFDWLQSDTAASILNHYGLMPESWTG